MTVLCVQCADPGLIRTYKKSGADEVIFALKDMSFSTLKGYSGCELRKAAASAHQENMRISVLMNRLFSQSEIGGVQKELEKLLASDIDAVYFADPALMDTAVRMHGENKMIYQSATLMTNSYDADWWMKQGLQSVVISPLLTKEEIDGIARHVKQLTLPVHGHFLMSVSRRRLLSAYGGKTGVSFLAENTSIQIREEKREGRMPVYETGYGTMIFTDFVQQSFQYIHEFIEAGIARFEIQTDYLDTENIKDTLHIYRLLLQGEKPDLSAYYAKYNLPFSEGYLGEKTIR